VDRDWLPARPVVATSIWRLAPPPDGAPITALLHWSSGSDLIWNRQSFGYKDREFPRFAALPRRFPSIRFLIAAGGGRVPHGDLREAGWELGSPLAVSQTVDGFMDFVSSSRADFGVAKHAYVASRSGWFADRSASFLAAGRPVLHQQTGYTDWLPVGEGVLCFSNPDDAAEAVQELERDYHRHARAARPLAEEHFEARKVLAQMLESAGLR
jgi:hypothetical protein